jgi:predicted NUDIX family NTP pyrophosphohydrolase
MPERSAGLLLWRRAASTPELEVWIAHMGGPFWARKEARAWSIPKGLFADDEPPLDAALREFAEEMGAPAPPAPDGGGYEPLGEFRQRSGKVVTAFAVEAPGFELDEVRSNTFPLEWPPRSGRTLDVPEVDRAEWTPLDLARERLVVGQVPLLDALEARHL